MVVSSETTNIQMSIVKLIMFTSDIIPCREWQSCLGRTREGGTNCWDQMNWYHSEKEIGGLGAE